MLRLLPRPGRSGPVPGPRVLVALETVTVHRGLVRVAVSQARERKRPALARSARFCFVGEDRAKPRGQRRAAFEPLDPGDNGEPCVLDDLFGYRVGLDVATRHPAHHRVVTLDE